MRVMGDRKTKTLGRGLCESKNQKTKKYGGRKIKGCPSYYKPHLQDEEEEEEEEEEEPKTTKTSGCCPYFTRIALSCSVG